MINHSFGKWNIVVWEKLRRMININRSLMFFILSATNVLWLRWVKISHNHMTKVVDHIESYMF